MNRSSELFLNKSSLLIDIHLEKSSTGDVAGFLYFKWIVHEDYNGLPINSS